MMARIFQHMCIFPPRQLIVHRNRLVSIDTRKPMPDHFHPLTTVLVMPLSLVKSDAFVAT